LNDSEEGVISNNEFKRVIRITNQKLKRMEGVNSTMINLIHCKNFGKCHNVTLTHTTTTTKKLRST
jgi:hypothetical protein